MKTKLLLIIGLLQMVINCKAQIPMPCWQLDSYSNNDLINLNSNCIDVSNLAIDDNGNRAIRAFEQINIHPESYIECDSSGSFQFLLNDHNFELAWYEPMGTYTVVQYDKVEWGLRLNSEVESAINNFVLNGKNFNNFLQPTMNPFDPEQISVRADVSWQENGQWLFPKPVWGFYYEDYNRNMNNPDKNLWTWEEVPTDHKFRFRFTPTSTGVHRVHFHATISGYGYLDFGTFAFDVTQGDPSKSFLGKSQNGHFLETDDGKVFFPVGQNIWDDIFRCKCDKGSDDLVFQGCEECWEDQNDICCGISRTNMGGQYIHNSDSTQVRDNCYPLVSYIKLEEEIRKVKIAGVNSYRYIVHQGFSDIEFEDMNDYSQRLYQAWELDTVFKLNKELDLRCIFVLGLQNPFFWNHYGMMNWDWSIGDPCWHVQGTDRGWCYRRELGLSEPLEFFTNPIAKENWKKKLRYQFARWGYDTSIAAWEFFEEINQVGGGGYCVISNDTIISIDSQTNLPDTAINPIYNFEGWEGLYNYVQDDWVRKAVGDWNAEMASYIKNLLRSDQNLIGVNYMGAYPMEQGLVSSAPYLDANGLPITPCLSNNLDATFNIPELDIISWNNYENTSDRYKRIAEADGHHYNHWTCPFQDDDEIAYHNISKLMYLGESGILDLQGNCDTTTFLRDSYASPFTGSCAIAMGWEEGGRTKRWNQLAPINEFMENFVFFDPTWASSKIEPGWAESNTLTKRVEAVYLQNFDEQSPKMAGLIMNRTWNYFTNGVDDGENQGHCQDPNLEVLPFFFRFFDVIESTEEPLQFNNLGIEGLGKVKFFDMLTLQLLDSVEINTIGGQFILNQYPDLGELNNTERPFVFFTIDFAENANILRNQQVNLFPNNNKPNSQKYAFQIDGAIQIMDRNDNTFGGLPDFDGDMFDLRGRLISHLHFTNNTSNFISSLSSGVYILRISNTNEMFRLVIL